MTLDKTITQSLSFCICNRDIMILISQNCCVVYHKSVKTLTDNQSAIKYRYGYKYHWCLWSTYNMPDIGLSISQTSGCLSVPGAP